MDVHEALDKADMIASGGKPYGDTAFRVIATLAAEVRRLREVLASYQIEAARERGNG